MNILKNKFRHVMYCLLLLAGILTCNLTLQAETVDVKMAVPQLKSVIRKGNSSTAIKWGKSKGASGYQLQYATNENFTGSSLKTVKISKGSTVSKSVSGMSKKKDTYIRIRAYKKAESEYAYSRWSASVRLVRWNKKWKYASSSKIHNNPVTLYYSTAKKTKNVTVAINAGHGTRGGESYKTLCHPDGTPKVTGGSTAQGAVYATADNSGTTMLNGMSEASINLKIALALKDKLLAKGYNVLMLRQDDNSGLDVIGRTVFANNCADCHIAIHFDSTTSNKGAYYCSVPNNSSYRNMTPVRTHWQQHNKLGASLIRGLRNKSVKVWGNEALETDLMQTSFSTVPSVDIEMGDRATSTSSSMVTKMANGLLKGVQYFFG